MRLRVLLLLLLAGWPALAGTKVENWIQVTTPHFVIVTDANEKQGQRVADQFERIRSAFHSLFPQSQADDALPIIVLAIRDEKGFRTLEPQDYLTKGSLHLGGLFLGGTEKNYVLMRLDAKGEHPYDVVYHEYTHFLLRKSEFMPLWLSEGLAEYYQNTMIGEKQVVVGEPSAENLALLRREKLLPLATLFQVDRNSPYYHDHDKGSIFYAESWALTHYLKAHDDKEQTTRIAHYLEQVRHGADPVEAAGRCFGDLRELEHELEGYVGQGMFAVNPVARSSAAYESGFAVRPLPEEQAGAVRADFLAYSERSAEARALLDRVQQRDPNNVSAHETRGYLEFREGHLDEARKWYAKAVQLDSRSYLAHYYFAAMSMNSGVANIDEQVESSLRTAIKLNPSFAPAFDLLVAFLGVRGRNLDEAQKMGLNAIALDPSNVHYRINLASVLLKMNQVDEALEALRYAAKLTKTQEEAQTVDTFLMRAQEYAAAQARRKEQAQESEAEDADEADTSDSSLPAVFVAKGPHRFLAGTLQSVRCRFEKMDLTLAATANSLPLHSENYYQIQFSVLNLNPPGSIQPCKDLEGKPAKVEYVESGDPAATPRVLAIELHR